MSLAVARKAVRTPPSSRYTNRFSNGASHLPTFERIAQDERAVAARVRGKSGEPVNDRVMVRFDDRPDQSVTLADKEALMFTNYGFVRVGKDRVEASGGLTAPKVKVEGSPTLVLNGTEQRATVSDGYLVFGQ